MHPVATALEHLLAGPASSEPAELSDELAGALARPTTERDELLALLSIHDLWLAPLEQTAGRERYQQHPAVSALKHRLETSFIDRLTSRCPSVHEVGDTSATLRRLSQKDLVPPVYDWLARTATYDELVRFLTFEGGPDADFDDLVALAQVGISGDPKVALAANYWDEMGRGELGAVHTVLHDELVDAIDMPAIPRDELPVSVLERKAIGGLLVTNRYLQPEAIGAFGLIEMQAGPRCRAVVRALTRLGAPAGAFPFYEEHATADPIHGKEWLDRVVRPLAQHPRWSAGIVRGAQWRQEVNRRFFADALGWFAERVDREDVRAG